MIHYVYKFTHLGDKFPKCYVGKRSCDCPIDEDTYTSSSSVVKDSITNEPWLWKKEILGTYDTEEEAYEAEARFCTKLHIKTGIYYNKNPGGYGFSSDNYSKQVKGENHFNRGKKLSKETREKMSKAKKLYYKENKKSNSKEIREKIKQGLQNMSPEAKEERLKKLREWKRRPESRIKTSRSLKKYYKENTSWNAKFIIVNGTKYRSAKQAAEHENIAANTLNVARRNNRKIAKNIKGEIFTLEYQ